MLRFMKKVQISAVDLSEIHCTQPIGSVVQVSDYQEGDCGFKIQKTNNQCL